MRAVAFQKKILGWHRIYGRHDLPWRHTRDSYRILVSEVMLQQTQVDRVVQKYKSFLKRFPTVRVLAMATTASVLKEWQGLGYNRRGLYLHRAAKKIAKDYKGHMPTDVHALESLPGVGPYTARAIKVFTWNTREVFIETNIRRVYIHFFFPGHTRVSDKEIAASIEKTSPIKDSRRWYWALMDYGALALRDIENPNRKSTRYIRQSKFQGSRRQVRARLLTHLLDHKNGMTVREIERWFSRDSLLQIFKSADILKSLELDGFVKLDKGKWRIL